MNPTKFSDIPVGGLFTFAAVKYCKQNTDNARTLNGDSYHPFLPDRLCRYPYTPSQNEIDMALDILGLKHEDLIQINPRLCVIAKKLRQLNRDEIIQEGDFQVYKDDEIFVTVHNTTGSPAGKYAPHYKYYRLVDPQEGVITKQFRKLGEMERLEGGDFEIRDNKFREIVEAEIGIMAGVYNNIPHYRAV